MSSLPPCMKIFSKLYLQTHVVIVDRTRCLGLFTTRPLILHEIILSFILSINVRHTIYNKSFIAVIYHSRLVFYRQKLIPKCTHSSQRQIFWQCNTKSARLNLVLSQAPKYKMQKYKILIVSLIDHSNYMLWMAISLQIPRTVFYCVGIGNCIHSLVQYSRDLFNPNKCYLTVCLQRPNVFFLHYTMGKIEADVSKVQFGIWRLHFNAC